MTASNNDQQKPKLSSVLRLITLEGLAASILAAAMGLLYGLLISNDPLISVINNAIFLMGIVLGFFGLFFGAQLDIKFFKNMQHTDIKDQYLEKLSLRKERVIHLYRAFVVFVVAIILDLLLFYF